jgi:acyl-CoA synthetase (AMP-forming)/AMP-acid ligase II
MHTALRRQTLADLLHRSARRFPDKCAKNPSGKLLKRELRREHAGLFA